MGIIETIIRKIEVTIGIIVITFFSVLPEYNLKWLKQTPKNLTWLMFGINKNMESIGRFVHDICSLWISYDRFIERLKRENENI